MFMNPTPETSLYMALISSTDPSWRVQNNGTANINTATANLFITGSLTRERSGATGFRARSRTKRAPVGGYRERVMVVVSCALAPRCSSRISRSRVILS